MRVLVATLLMLTLQSTGRLDIVVRDANTREGVSGVPVTLTLRVPNEPAGLSSTVFTDPRGLAIFSALGVGSYAIRLGEGFQAQGGSLPAFVTLDAVTTRKLEISVKRIATVSGRIVNRDGGPSADANVALLSMAYVDGRQALRILRNATSDNDGNFRFIEIPSGDYYVRVEHQMPRTIAYYPGVVDPSGAQRLTLREQDLALGDIQLPNVPRFKVSGTVIHSPSEGGRALTIYLSHDNLELQEDPFLVSLSSRRVSSTEVRFELNDVPAGAYILYPLLGDRGLGSLGKESVRIDDRDVSDLKIVLKPMVGIAGRIVMKDAQSRLPENLRLATPSRDSFPPLLVSDLSRSAIAVARNGEFAVRNLIDGGRYGISVQGLPPDAFVSNIRLGNRSILSDSAFVAGVTEETFEVQIATPGGIVRGSVRDSGGQPVASASVVAVPDFPRRKNAAFYKRTTTDARGQFTIQGLAPGEYQLFALPGPPPQGAEEDPAFLGVFESRSTRISAVPGQAVEANLTLIN